MKFIELLIDEENIVEGVSAMSVVTSPAIMTNFVAFKSEEKEESPNLLVDKKIKFAAIEDEKRILLGPAMIPNMAIYRHSEERGEYYNYYTKETVRKASQLFMKNNRQNSATLEHEVGVGDMSIVESWIVEDENNDKSRLYGFDVPTGTWMISMKVYNDTVWNDFIKTGTLKGFSIEGFFSDSEEQHAKKRLEEAFKTMAKSATMRK